MLLLDRIILNHEIGHGIAVVYFGWTLDLVVANRHHPAAGDQHGKTIYWYPRDDRDQERVRFEHAVIAVAGRFCEPLTTSEQARSDDAAAVELVGVEGLAAVHFKAFTLFARRDVEAVTRALAAEMIERDRVIDGLAFERTVREHLPNLPKT